MTLALALGIYGAGATLIGGWTVFIAAGETTSHGQGIIVSTGLAAAATWPVSVPAFLVWAWWKGPAE